MVEPQRPVVAVRPGDGVEAVKEGLPEVGVGNVAAGEDAARIEWRVRVVLFGIARWFFVVKADGSKERAQFRVAGSILFCTRGDGGSVRDEVLQVVIGDERRDVALDDRG